MLFVTFALQFMTLKCHHWSSTGSRPGTPGKYRKNVLMMPKERNKVDKTVENLNNKLYFNHFQVE